MASLLQYALTWVLALTIMVLPLAAADGVPKLRIMPLGDSITKGNGSPDMNGYRSKLRERLVSSQKDSNFSVDMVGSLRDGGMQDNDHEGHSGKYLADIRQYLELSIDAKPNIVLVHAGTNNMDKEVDLDKADQLIESIIDRLFEGSRGVTVLIAPVIWANDPRMQRNTDAYNTKLRAIIKRRQQEGQHLLEVPISITASDLSDKKHPNSVGYGKMAAAWYDGILEAQTRGWIQTPAAVNAHDHPGMGLGDGAASPISGGNCGDNFKGKGKVFDGFRTWEAVGTIIGAMEGARRENVILADLNGDGHTDYILADDDGTVRAWISTATSESPWMSLGNINPDWTDVSGAMVRMADVDNDGKADLIVLYSDGVAKVWKNVDNGRKFKSLDAKWATGLDQPREKVHFRDMDGDGYADYVILYEGGAVDWARNTHNNGQDDQKRNWEKAVAIAPGPAGEPDNRAQIFDLDGDNMADYLVIYDGGAVKAWRNTGSLNEKGHNWQSLGTIAPGIEGVTGNMIRFADMDGDGKADFLAIADDGSIRMWKSLGIVGGKGSSMRFADLDGDGHADIVSIDAQGRARGWLNKGGNKWDDLGEIAPGLDEDLSSSTIHFADVDGDKLDDFLIVYGGGAVKAYLNNGNIPDKGKDRIWQPSIIISEGVGDPGRKVEFADLNGDGYADYLIVFDGGAVDCWLNQKNIPPKGGERIWGGRTTVGTGVKEPGSKVHFADITGDRKAEYIIQYDGGSAKGYRNTGNIPDAGKDRNWVDLGTVSNRASTEGTVAYADINGDGKADYLVVLPSGEVHAYINSCSWTPPPPDKGDGDDGDGGDDGDNGSGGNGPDESHDGGQNWPSDDYEKCFVTDCDITCAPGLTILETFKTRCGEKSICCPPQRTPQNCTWTSGKPDEAKPVCIGLCDPGTVLLATNSDLCDTGNDAYCCESKQYQKVRDECHLGRDGCDNGYYQVAKENDQSSYYEIRPVCCKQQLKNCHWVKKNECTESNCEPYEFLLTTNPMGQWVYLCPAPYTMSLCCDAPDGIEPFLPVDLENLFPDPPPVEDRVKWDLQILGGYEGTDGEMVDKNSSDDPNTGAFGFVLIAGPDDSLSSFSKRDGSDIELLDCESFKSGTEFQRTRLICINDGEDNNCDDILKGGLNGTVVRMPEGCGPGTYIVAHSLEESDNQTLPDHLVKRAPSTRKVMDLNFSFNFGLAKRAASVDDRLQIRVDYSNIPGYWNDIVDEEGEESSDKRRRGITPRISAHDISHKELHKRFFSDDSASWGRKINKLVSAPYYTDLSYDFDSPMFYEKIDNCKGEQEKYLSMWAKGECKVGTKFGFTFIGTLDEFHLSQAYGFIDFKFDMETTIGVKGNAALNTKFRMKSAETKTKQEVGFSHPGLFDFKPQFDVDIGVQAEKATFAGDFTATIRTLTDDDDNDGWVHLTLPESAGATRGSIITERPDEGQFNGHMKTTDGNVAITVQPILGMFIDFSEFAGKDIQKRADGQELLYYMISLFNKNLLSYDRRGVLLDVGGAQYYVNDDGRDQAHWKTAKGGEPIGKVSGRSFLHEQNPEEDDGYPNLDWNAPIEDPALWSGKGVLSCPVNEDEEDPICDVELCGTIIECPEPASQIAGYDNTMEAGAPDNDDDQNGGTVEGRSIEDELADEFDDLSVSSGRTLAKRDPAKFNGGRRPFRNVPCKKDDRGNDGLWKYSSYSYPTVGAWDVGDMRYRHVYDSANAYDASEVSIGTLNIGTYGNQAVTEHIMELQTMKLFFVDVHKNQMPDRSKSGFKQIHCGFLDMLSEPVLSNPPPTPGAKAASQIPIQRIMQRHGWKEHWNDFVLLERTINRYKENFWSGKRPIAPSTRAKLSKDPTKWCAALKNIRMTINVFTYLNNDDVQKIWVKVSNGIRYELGLADQVWINKGNKPTFIQSYWDKWIRGHMDRMVEDGTKWARESIAEMRQYWATSTNKNAALVLKKLDELEGKLSEIEIVKTSLE